jgi:hypothetical protein
MYISFQTFQLVQLIETLRNIYAKLTLIFKVDIDLILIYN